MKFTKTWLWQTLMWLDCGLNAILLGGWHDEWVSTRAWRLRDVSKFWRLAQRSIDAVAELLGQKQHCYWSAVSDSLHRAVPPAQR